MYCGYHSAFSRYEWPVYYPIRIKGLVCLSGSHKTLRGSGEEWWRWWVNMRGVGLAGKARLGLKGLLLSQTDFAFLQTSQFHIQVLHLPMDGAHRKVSESGISDLVRRHRTQSRMSLSLVAVGWASRGGCCRALQKPTARFRICRPSPPSRWLTSSGQDCFWKPLWWG